MANRLRPFRLHIAGSPPGCETRIYADAPPFDQATFEYKLATGEIDGRHWPADLPDRIDPNEPLRRHRLVYIWDERQPILGVVSCNPSKATRRLLDATLLATVNQAAIWGFGGIEQGNVSPIYMTDSARVHESLDLNDQENHAAIGTVLANDTVWLAWGARPAHLHDDWGTAWNSAEDAILATAWERQVVGLRIIAQRVNKGSGYKPPGHPSPRRIPPSRPPMLYNCPLSLTIVRRSRSR